MIKNLFTIFIFIMIPVVFCGQNTNQDTFAKEKQHNYANKIIIDTLKIKTIYDKETKNVWYKDNNIPWIIALVISIFGLILNVYLINRQIEANRENTIKQIQATLNTNNRQAWITETRNVITELMTQANLLNIEFQEANISIEKKKILHEKFTYNKNKLFLLLKLDKEKHKNIIDSLTELMTILDTHMLNSKANNERNMNIPFDNSKFMNQIDIVINNGRILLYDEWGKIQSII